MPTGRYNFDQRPAYASDAAAHAREYYAQQRAGAAERREALERDGGEIPAVNLQPIMQPTRPPRAPRVEPTAPAKASPELSALDKAVEALVRQHSSGAVIDAAWEAAQRIFHPGRRP
jgi:hypothetical protein